MIIQGSNQPLLIRFEVTNVRDIQDISIVVCYHSAVLKNNADKIVKRWGMSDVEINEVTNTVIAPLTQQETEDMQPGNASIEIKWMLGDGYVHHSTVAAMVIAARCDETILHKGA